jgi:hypothetical protein
MDHLSSFIDRGGIAFVFRKSGQYHRMVLFFHENEHCERATLPICSEQSRALGIVILGEILCDEGLL